MSYPKSLIVASLGMTLFVFIACPLVYGATTSIGQSITSGYLNITVPSSISLDAKTVQSSGQITNATLPINVNDQRGVGAGWTSSMTVQNLTITQNPFADNANTGPLIVLDDDNRYDGSCGVSSPGTSYTVTIASGGSVGTSAYSVTGGCSDTNQSNVTTAATGNSVGTRGVKIKFPDGNYISDDSWVIHVDVYPYATIVVTPQAPSAAVAGSDLDGVNEADEETLTGAGAASSPKVLLTADSDKGMGSYDQDVLLQSTVHAFSSSGTYSGLITLDVT